ncbi:uncharacterized protein LOC112181445 [Rosa chinensis]|uniref:uncharacterized protein LOC112181445 n=1 Tax=Rosa chinensis TaxID=74649 RepID=UPI000D08A041|nr:uncharacterized protein LOC112181445 [Rosa chinensis]
MLTRKLGFKDNICYSHERDLQGMALIWNDDTHAELCSRSPNHIDVVIGKAENTLKWRFTGIYGVAVRGERHRTWSLIKTLASKQCSLPWLVAGDFNEIMSNNDKFGGPPRAVTPMATFRRTLADCDLLDMGFVGSHFTWSRPSTGNALEQLSRKIYDTGTKLMQWYKSDFDNQKAELHVIEEKLNDLMPLPYSPEQYEEQRLLHVKHSQILAQQELYWRQRSRAIWLKDGDRNSAYFHRRACNRRSKNLIPGLKDEQNQWQTDPREVQRLLLSYFSRVFSTESCDLEALAQIIEATPVKVTLEMNNDLLKPYLEKEMKAAIFQMHPQKVLALTIKDPQDAAHFRPIALGNVIYRIASKVVANRLKPWLPAIISPLQSAYVPGRIVSDNTLVANEVAHFNTGFFSLKLDISKAYDRLEWNYLQAILSKLGFHPTWINMVMRNVKFVTYSILQHGNPTPPISPSRGIRQGDLLSPLLFGTATIEECIAFKQILGIYERVSGQKINFQKSSVGFNRNVSIALQHNLAAIFAVERVEEHDKYLGLPLRGWRIISNPQSLIAKLYKAKYFPHCSFWEAEIGDSPSFSWISILQGRAVLQAGVQWKIGDGTQVDIWQDKWIPVSTPTQISRPLNTSLSKVADLIDESAQQWKANLIHDLFPDHIAERILCIPLGRHPHPDKIIWRPEKKGYYSCPMASTIISAPPFNLPIDLHKTMNFKDWMLDRALTLSNETFAKLMMIIWAIWKNRNNFLWKGTQQTAQDILLSSFAWLEEFQKALTPAVTRRQQHCHFWQPAPTGAFKMNMDASYLSNQTKGGIGGVLRTETGQVVAAFASPIPHLASLKQGELYAIRAGVDLVKSLQLQQVVIESDCTKAIVDASCPDHSLLENGGLIDDIKRAMAEIPHVQLCYAPRSCNMVAHRLAGIGFESIQRIVWRNHTPECILDVVTYDCHHLT